ncbi:MAG: VWA domain-containing protein [Saprospiraceae bacterium]
MFRLESPYYFLLLLLLLIVYLSYSFFENNSKKYWNKLGNLSTLKRSLNQNIKQVQIQKILFYASLFFIVICLVNPQFGMKKQKVKSQSAEIIIALDISQSMMAEDIKPNRLSRAKIWIKQFTDRFPSEKIGLITFAGNAYLQSPITTDVATINLAASIADPQLASTQGTSISEAIQLAIKSFVSQEGFHKLLIVITDGEDHEGEAIEAANEAYKHGISIVCIPMGTDEGSPIPIRTESGNDYKRDKEDNTILTKPNKELLQQICAQSNGLMLDLNTGDEVFVKLKEKIKSILKKETNYQSFNELEPYFQWPLLISIILLSLSIFLNEKEKQLK